MGDDEVEPAVAVWTVVAQVLGDQRGGEMWPDHDDVPLTTQRVLGGQFAAKHPGTGFTGMPAPTAPVRTVLAASRRNRALVADVKCLASWKQAISTLGSARFGEQVDGAAGRVGLARQRAWASVEPSLTDGGAHGPGDLPMAVGLDALGQDAGPGSLGLARTALTIRATSAVVRPWISRRSSLITSGWTNGITAKLAGSAPTSSRATPQPTARARATAPSRPAGSNPAVIAAWNAAARQAQSSSATRPLR